MAIRLVYDYQIFSHRYGGISRYICELARRIGSYKGFNVSVKAPLYFNRHLRSLKSLKVAGFYVPIIPKIERIIEILNREAIERNIDLFNRLVVKKILKNNPPDIIHETYYSKEKAADSSKTRIVLTVHDMIHEKFSEYIPLADEISLSKKCAVERADHIICVSENTRNDLVNILNVKPEKISVIYEGVNIRNLSQISTRRIIEGDYLLYVGYRKHYKNFRRFLMAFAKSKQLNSNLKIVCFGQSSILSSDEISLLDELKIGIDKIIIMKGNDDVLNNLYAHATAFVYPSLYEGFGLPVLEAMSLGCPVASSNTSSLPEVVGDAAELFDPFNIDSIAVALERVVFSTERRALLRHRGIERAKYFTWDKCADRTRAVYNNLV